MAAVKYGSGSNMDYPDTPKKEQKYFTPEIEDLRVGYECEIGILDYSSTGPIKEWEKYIIGQGVEFTNSLRERNPYRLPSPEFLRVPYLNQKQIEGEGWVFMDVFAESIRFHKNFSGKSWYQLTWEEKSKWLVIERKSNESDSNNSHNKFTGYCKDINTLRFILKLLAI